MSGPTTTRSGLHEVRDRRPLLQELGVRGVAELALAELAEPAADVRARCRPARCSSSRSRARTRRAGPRSPPRRARGRRRPSRSAACPRTRTAAARAPSAEPPRARSAAARGCARRGPRGPARRSARRPCAKRSILAASMSRHHTWWPSSAKQAAVTRPTQPTPITPMGGFSGMPCRLSAAASGNLIHLTRDIQRATPSISFAETVWSSVFETQYDALVRSSSRPGAAGRRCRRAGTRGRGSCASRRRAGGSAGRARRCPAGRSTRR